MPISLFSCIDRGVYNCSKKQDIQYTLFGFLINTGHTLMIPADSISHQRVLYHNFSCG